MVLMKRLLPLFIVMLIVGVIAGCGTQPNKPATTGTNPADIKGEVTVYTALNDDLIAIYLKKFNTIYPNIKVNVVAESTGIVTSKIIAKKLTHKRM